MNALDAAAFLGVHVETLRKLARRRAIPSFKIGRDWRFQREALLRWADEQQRPMVGSHSVGGCSVLLVDDDELVRRAMARVVDRCGCHARQVSSGLEALEQVRQQVPDIILLDLKMPDMNGPQFLAELRPKHPLLPVVIVTGYPDSALMMQASQFAPVMLLSKPVAPELLERTVRALAGERSEQLATRSTG